MKMYSIFVLLFTIVGSIYGYSYHFGKCPDVEPMANFNMEQFLGEWHVIEKSTTFARCLMYNYKNTDTPGEYSLTLSSPNVFSWFTKKNHKLSYQGKLYPVDMNIPSKMIIKFPLSVAGLANYTVIDTDYSNYALVFTCQKLAFAHRQAASILSRTNTLDNEIISNLRNTLIKHGIDPFLSIINQENCPDASGYKRIHIDNDTPTLKGIGQVGKVVGEGVGEKISRVITNKLQSAFGNADKNFIREKRDADDSLFPVESVEDTNEELPDELFL